MVLQALAVVVDCFLKYFLSRAEKQDRVSVERVEMLLQIPLVLNGKHLEMKH